MYVAGSVPQFPGLGTAETLLPSNLREGPLDVPVVVGDHIQDWVQIFLFGNLSAVVENSPRQTTLAEQTSDE
ncbi:hypothetical protein [Natronococcus sp. A-GB7]|uniref:hypothetical protein n=1 Tax=Natronococcus sp. A-GB7 TaxID=3037649 RepID=UPI00241DA719|nr:hypothetical protein [Natronococcus sp. A-GB7]MDG5821428.1 hypothetical protein [Natronococcus sp. A-GB7]